MSELTISNSEIDRAAIETMKALFSDLEFTSFASRFAAANGGMEENFSHLYKITARSIKAAFDEIRAS